MTEAKNVSALLFDLGGVIIEIDFSRALNHWSESSRLPIEEIEQRFKMDEEFQRHERGELQCSDYFTYLRQLLELDASDEEIELGWNSIFVDQITNTLDCISAIGTKLPCYAFTNSNPTHQDFWMATFPNAINVFEQVFVSSDLGLRKPERRAFEAIATATGKPLDEILFFDDTQENVEGARAAGMPGVLVKNPTDVEQALVRIGVLKASSIEPGKR